MDIFTQLNDLISSQASASSSPGEVVAGLGTPSASIAILKDGSIAKHCISTIGDNENTVFQACSISKPIACMAVMKLIQRGTLRLDAPVTEYLDEAVLDGLAIGSSRALLAFVTIRHLMDHTSGMAVGGFSGYYNGDWPSLETVISGQNPANTLQIQLESFPGMVYSYSGGAITILQFIAEKVSGKALPELVQDLVLDPLGMRDSFYGAPESRGNFARAHYTGYTPCEEKYHLNREEAAAGLWTTPADLLKAIQAMQRSIKTPSDGHEFLSGGLARDMVTPVGVAKGLGWQVPEGSRISFGHTGQNFPGYTCIVLGFTDLTSDDDRASNEKSLEGIGISVMTNSIVGDNIFAKIVAAICYLQQWPIVVADHVGIVIPFIDKHAKIDGAWKEWKGEWQDGWTVLEKDGFPMAQYAGLPPVRLYLAATPRTKYPEGQSIDLVPEGLETAVRFIWVDGQRQIEVLHRRQRATFSLKRKTT